MQFQQSVSSELKCLGRSSYTLCVNSPLVIRQALHPEASKKVEFPTVVSQNCRHVTLIKWTFWILDPVVRRHEFLLNYVFLLFVFLVITLTHDDVSMYMLTSLLSFSSLSVSFLVRPISISILHTVMLNILCFCLFLFRTLSFLNVSFHLWTWRRSFKNAAPMLALWRSSHSPPCWNVSIACLYSKMVFVVTSYWYSVRNTCTLHI